MTDNELFEIIERDFTSFCFKATLRHEALREAPHLNGLLVDYGGDIPRSEGIKPDIMVRIMTIFERNEFTKSELLAKQIVFKLKPHIRIFIESRPILNANLKKRSENWEYLTHEQTAMALGLSIQQYNRGRARAKENVIYFAKELREAARAKKRLVVKCA